MNVNSNVALWEKNRDIVEDFALSYKLKEESDEIWGLVQTTQHLIDAVLILIYRYETETNYSLQEDLKKELEEKIIEAQEAYNDLSLEME